MIGRFFGFALARVGDALDALCPMEITAQVEQQREEAAREALQDKEAEEEVAEPTSLAYTDNAADYKTYRCADCAWESFNYPALRAHREREHPTPPASVAAAADLFPQYTKASAAVDPPNPAAESSEEVVSPAPLATTSSGHLAESDAVADFIAAEHKRLSLGQDLRDAVGDNYDHGAGNDDYPLWHENGLADAIDWEGVAYALFSEWNIAAKPGHASARTNLAGAVSTGCSTGQSLEEWLEPVIQEVLTEHRHCGVYRYCTVCRCGEPGMGYYQDWQNHVTCILAEQLAKAITAHQK